MSLKPFLFPRELEDQQRNWDSLTQGTAFKAFTPAISGFTGTVPTILRGYAQLLGPVVFVFVHLKSTAEFGWNANATIDLIHQPYTPTVESFPQNVGPIVDVTTALPIGTEHPAITAGPTNTGRLTLLTALSSVGGPTEITISGFYLRN